MLHFSASNVVNVKRCLTIVVHFTKSKTSHIVRAVSITPAHVQAIKVLQHHDPHHHIACEEAQARLSCLAIAPLTTILQAC